MLTRSFPITDYSKEYGSLMQFNKNKTAFIHQWYPFVEGYSRDFIHTVVNEINYNPRNALDMFSGSGTTPVELQYLGIPCHSIEVSPFMHLLTTVKMNRGYKVKEFDEILSKFKNRFNSFKGDIRTELNSPVYKTIEPRSGIDKYVFNKAVMTTLLKIKFHINQMNNSQYKNLFKIAFASILLEVSNLYRNGKCLSYKKEWEFKRPKESTVLGKFYDQLERIIRPDIDRIEIINSGGGNMLNNVSNCYHGDARELLKRLPNNSVDLVITSPPYLNSRDYTDIYMIEIWMLDLVKNYSEVRELRKSTLRSHVQVTHGDIECLKIELLERTLKKIEKNKEDYWDRGLNSMIKGYFKDMDILFNELRSKMQPKKSIYFNIANSAYFGVEIKVDEIICEIAETRGFKVREIREARKLKPSVQQRAKIKGLRESVIVMES
ncbi:MAG: site-specific DNA-methyltransferase [Cyclobacteriaceae bacterium]|nr:site-specific DNA-methyltransferase [Cyclobacteriaceae bacterium]